MNEFLEEVWLCGFLGRSPWPFRFLSSQRCSLQTPAHREKKVAASVCSPWEGSALWSPGLQGSGAREVAPASTPQAGVRSCWSPREAQPLLLAISPLWPASCPHLANEREAVVPLAIFIDVLYIFIYCGRRAGLG